MAAQKPSRNLSASRKGVRRVEKLVELNLQVAKAAMGEAAETTRPPCRSRRASTDRPADSLLQPPPRRPPRTAVRSMTSLRDQRRRDQGREETASDSQKNSWQSSTAREDAPAARKCRGAGQVGRRRSEQRLRKCAKASSRLPRWLKPTSDHHLSASGQPGPTRPQRLPDRRRREPCVIFVPEVNFDGAGQSHRYLREPAQTLLGPRYPGILPDSQYFSPVPAPGFFPSSRL